VLTVYPAVSWTPRVRAHEFYVSAISPVTDFRQTFVTGASRDRDNLITSLGQKIKVQGHTIAAEAHST